MSDIGDTAPASGFGGIGSFLGAAKSELFSKQPKQTPQPFDVGNVPKATPGGPSFATRGVGKFYNPGNTNGNQFNKPAMQKATETALNSYATAKYFRNAGMGQALRYTLGMRPVPSHMNDWIIAEHNKKTASSQGLQPTALQAHTNPAQEQEYEHW